MQCIHSLSVSEGICPLRRGYVHRLWLFLTKWHGPDLTISHSSLSLSIHLAADGVVAQDMMVNQQK